MLGVAAGLLLGLTLAAPPGPMNALIAREAARHGTWPAIRVGVAAPLADLLFLAALWFGLAPLLEGPAVVRGAAVLGALLMAFFALGTTRTGSAETPTQATFGAAFLMAVSNPYQIAWWLSGGFVFLHAQGASGVLGLVLGIFAWVVVFSWATAHGARRWPWFRPLVDVLSADLLLAFALLLGLVAAGVLRAG